MGVHMAHYFYVSHSFSANMGNSSRLIRIRGFHSFRYWWLLASSDYICLVLLFSRLLFFLFVQKGQARVKNYTALSSVKFSHLILSFKRHRVCVHKAKIQVFPLLVTAYVYRIYILFHNTVRNTTCSIAFLLLCT